MICIDACGSNELAIHYAHNAFSVLAVLHPYIFIYFMYNFPTVKSSQKT